MKPATLISLRRWHHYIGVFLGPAILFFSATGFIQVLGWQDQRNPPAWVSWVAGIHKKQAAPKPRPPKPAVQGIAPRGEHEAEPFVPLKIFALLTALGLTLSTLIGVAVALGTRAMRRKSLVMLAAGVVVPVVLMLL